MEKNDLAYHAGLSELLDQNLSAYEFFNGLPADVQKKLAQEDIRSFSDLQAYADRYHFLR